MGNIPPSGRAAPLFRFAKEGTTSSLAEPDPR